MEIAGVKKVKKGTLKDAVCAQIKELILTNTFQPGQPLVIDQIASSLGVSHTPVREALAMLELDGLVELTSYQNPRVADVTEADVCEVYEMRLMVETWAIEHCVSTLSDETLNDFGRALAEARSEAERGNYQYHLKSDILLHQTILQSTGNTLFWMLSGKVHERSLRIRSLVEVQGRPRDVLAMISEHDDILAALRRRDPAQARHAMQVHLEAGQRRTLLVLPAFNKAG